MLTFVKIGKIITKIIMKKTFYSSKKRRILERQNTKVNLLSHLNFDTSNYAEDNKSMNPFINSSIIQAKEIYYIKELFTNKKYISFSLVYKLSRHSKQNFHNLCYNIGPNLSIIKIRTNSNTSTYNLFGRFTSLNWECSKKIKTDETAFIFSLTKKKCLDPNILILLFFAQKSIEDKIMFVKSE